MMLKTESHYARLNPNLQLAAAHKKTVCTRYLTIQLLLGTTVHLLPLGQLLLTSVRRSPLTDGRFFINSHKLITTALATATFTSSN